MHCCVFFCRTSVHIFQTSAKAICECLSTIYRAERRTCVRGVAISTPYPLTKHAKRDLIGNTEAYAGRLGDVIGILDTLYNGQVMDSNPRGSELFLQKILCEIIYFLALVSRGGTVVPCWR